MPRAIPIMLWALAFAPLLAAREPAACSQDYYGAYATARLELGRWCEQNFLPCEAGECYGDASEWNTGELGAQAKAARGKLDAKSAKDPTAEIWGEFLKRSYDIEQDAASDCANLAATVGNKDYWIARALQHDPHNEAARVARGEKRIEGLGWFAEADWKKLDVRRIKLDAKKAPDGDGPYIIETEHYAILSDLSLTGTKPAAQQAECLYGAFRDKFGDVIPAPRGRMGIRIYRKKEDFTAAILGLPHGEGETQTHAGCFQYHDGHVYICEESTRKRGGLKRTVSHECTHQLVTLGMCDEPGIGKRYSSYFRLRDNTWLVEGTAVYFEKLKRVNDTKYELDGGADELRRFWLTGEENQGKLESFDDFLKLTEGTWRTCEFLQLTRRYAMGGEIVDLCMEGGVESRTRAYKAALQRYYRGQGSAAEFVELLGADKAKLASEWSARLKIYLPMEKKKRDALRRKG